jgi:hypothetical protein
MHAVLFLLVASKEVEKCLLQSCCCKLLKNPSCQSALLLTCTTGVQFQCLLPRLDAFILLSIANFKFLCCQKHQLSLICISYIPLQEQQKRGSSTIWKISTHNNPTATLNKLPHPKTRKEKQKSFSKLYKLQFLMTMETWE